MRTMWLINHSTRLEQQRLHDWAAVFTEQLGAQFADSHGLAALVKVHEPPPDDDISVIPEEVIHIFDHGTQAGLAGYHVARRDGTPEGYVLLDEAGDTLDDWSQALDHEIIEQVGDGIARLVVPVTLPRSFGKLAGLPAAVAYEFADPVQESGYRRRGVMLSNFVYPWYFVDTAINRGEGWDFCGELKGPLDVAPGGYLSFTLDLANWHEFGGRTRKLSTLGRYNRRRMR